MAHYDVFRRQLACKYPANGYALWEPSPRFGHEHAQIGDVGFIRNGRFHRLFNALLPEDHPSHRQFGVPPHHEMLVPSVSDHIDRSSLNRNHYCSPGVTIDRAAEEIEIYAANVPDIPEVSFSCKNLQGGAVLSIPVQAQSQNTLALGDFRQWMLKHIDHWFEFAQRLGLGIMQMEEIVLITGCDYTRSWTNVVFFEGQSDPAQASFGVKLAGGYGPNAGIKWHFSPERVQGALLRHGPEGENLPENQSIFIRGFRVSRVFKFLPKHLKAAAGVFSDPDESHKDPDSDSELMSIALTPEPEYRDPLHLLLDYITERATDCDMAIVHDDDLTWIRDVCDGTDFQPDAVMKHLRTSNLDIYQVPCNVSPTQEKLDTGAEIVKVATLSATRYNQMTDSVSSSPVICITSHNMDVVEAHDHKQLDSVRRQTTGTFLFNQLSNPALLTMLSETSTRTASVTGFSSKLSSSSSSLPADATCVSSLTTTQSPQAEPFTTPILSSLSLPDSQFSSPCLISNPAPAENDNRTEGPAEADPLIIEALKSKERLFLFHIGKEIERIINERKGRVEITTSTSYQRLLVHRCSAYYRVTPESDASSKSIWISYSLESRIPPKRISELVPLEQTKQLAINIKNRSVKDRTQLQSQSCAGYVNSKDAESLDVEPSEPGNAGGCSSAPIRPMTLEECEAAYKEARSRISLDFEKKAKEKDMSGSSSTLSLVSGLASSSGGGNTSTGDTDDSISIAPTKSQSQLPASFGRLSHMLYLGYLGQTFGPDVAKRHLCHNVLCYVEDEHDVVISQELLRPDYCYPGLPGTFSVSHDLYSYVQCNSVAADNTRRIILDCEVPRDTMRVVPQSLFAPYAGLSRSPTVFQSASLLPPTFFFRLDYSVGLPLETARSAVSRTPSLLYNDWCPMSSKASIKLRIAWYGYRPWQTQIQLRNRRKEQLTLPQLVQLVASGVDRFLRKEHGPITDPTFPEWRIGDHPFISSDRIVLVGVVATSSGSIMPIMRLTE